jgi:hypothetical protein
MSRAPHVPPELRLMPFRGTDVVAAAVLTSSQLRGGGWRRLFPDVYIAADVPLDHRLWCHAALLYARRRVAAVSGLSAAYAWGVDLLGSGDVAVELTVPTGVNMHPRPPYLAVVHAALDQIDVTLAGNLAATSPVRTAFDLGRRLTRVEAVVALDALSHRRLVKPDAVGDYGLAHPSWRGARQLTDVLGLVEPLAESPMESRLRVALIDAGLPRPVAQVEVRDERGRLIGRVDLAYPARRVAIEYEGDHHRGRSTFRADITRGNAMHGAGWTIVRATYADIYPSVDKFAAHVRSLIS